MQPFRYHVFACEQKKPDGAPCCSARGAAAVIAALRHEVAAAGLNDTVQITTTGSLGLCERGPNLVVYPEGTWYSGVTAADVREIVREHFKGGTPVERLAHRDEAAVKAEIQGNRARAHAAIKAREAAGAVPDELMGMLRGYQESRILLTGDRAGRVHRRGRRRDAPRRSPSAAAPTRRATELLLNALVALERGAARRGELRELARRGAVPRGRLAATTRATRCGTT